MSASYNGYGYVHGNPVNLTDPSGKSPFLAVIAGGLIGGGIDLAMQLLVEGKDLQSVDWGSVAFSALTGAVGGGIGSLTNKMGFIARVTILIMTKLDEQIVEAIANLTIPDNFKERVEQAIQNQVEHVEALKRMEDIKQIVERINFRWEKGFMTPEE